MGSVLIADHGDDGDPAEADHAALIVGFRQESVHALQ